jgi:hypothetical protein
MNSRYVAIFTIGIPDTLDGSVPDGVSLVPVKPQRVGEPRCRVQPKQVAL